MIDPTTIIDESRVSIARHIGRQSLKSPHQPDRAQSLDSLLERTKSLCDQALRETPQPVPIIHHFACTGGTLLSRCLGAQPNAVILSEIDPLSTIPLRAPDFAPYDLIRHIQTGMRPVKSSQVEEIFLDYFASIHEHLSSLGRRVIIRDHAHSQYCMQHAPTERQTIREVLGARFKTRSLITVRHPVYSFIPLRKKNWVMFEPNSFDEYCRRYHVFLDDHADAPVIRYEDFVRAPDEVARQMLEYLDLPHANDWQLNLPNIRLSGDSGRSGDTISERPPRPVPAELVDECRKSASYAALCERLGYDAVIGVS